MGLTPNARTQGHAEWQQRPVYAPVPELVNESDSKSDAEMLVGSSPTGSTSGSLGLSEHPPFVKHQGRWQETAT